MKYCASVQMCIRDSYNIISNVPFLLLAMILSYILGAGMRSLIITMTCTAVSYTHLSSQKSAELMRNERTSLRA